MSQSPMYKRAFLLLLGLVTFGFFAVLWSYIGAVFWAMVLGILFAPLHKKMLEWMPKRNNLAALSTLVLCLVVAILPLVAIVLSLINEVSAMYTRISTGHLSVNNYTQQVFDRLPSWVTPWLERLHIGSLAEIQDKLSNLALQVSKLAATKAVDFGQNTLGFIVSFGIMLYLLYFMLRDGKSLAALILDAIPLEPAYKRELGSKFTTVIRATVKGNLAVAAVQGALGGLIFWILGVEAPVLWAVVMAFLSLLPAVGAGLIWAPVAIYFLATGNMAKGLILISYGILVIGLVDNALRPLLVGKDTKMPDYIVLMSTLGGMSLFGLTGFVIGPAIAALFMACWDLFSDMQKQGKV